MASLGRFLPQRQEIRCVFGTVVFAVYSWAVRGFLYQLPALRIYYQLGDILMTLLYVMAFALVESLLVTGILLLVSAVLPERWFRDGFAYKGFILILVTSITMIALQGMLGDFMPWLETLYRLFGIAAIALITLIFVFHSFPRLQNFLLLVEERLQIFLYVYIPLGVMGALIVLIRNLWR